MGRLIRMREMTGGQPNKNKDKENSYYSRMNILK